MATSNQGTKFRRISSEKYHSRSASTGDILTNFPPSYPESYNAMMHSATTGQTNRHSNTSSRNGGSFDHLMEGERVGFSALSMTGTASPESVTLRGYDRQNSATHLKPYTHSHASGITRSRRDGSGGKRRSVQSPPSLPHSLPTQHALDHHSSRESSHSHLGRESGSYIRLTHRRSRDSMSQDTLGEREFDYRYRYDTNHSSTLPTLSLQDPHHREHSSSRRHSWGRERGILSDDRDLRRKLQEFDVMPIHEAFRHEAMESAPNEAVPQYPPPNNPAGVDSVAVIDHQPLAATQHISPENAREGASGNNQPLPHSYLPVFFSPESGLLYMNVDGGYKLLPNQYLGNATDGPITHPEQQPHSSAQQLESGSRQTSSSYGLSAPYDYYYCSIVMLVLYILCLNILAVFLCSIPALWFAKKAMQAKYEGDYAGTLSLGTKALCLNIVGGFVHILFLFAIMFTPILLRFVFNVI